MPASLAVIHATGSIGPALAAACIASNVAPSPWSRHHLPSMGLNAVSDLPVCSDIHARAGPKIRVFRSSDLGATALVPLGTESLWLWVWVW